MNGPISHLSYPLQITGGINNNSISGHLNSQKKIEWREGVNPMIQRKRREQTSKQSTHEHMAYSELANRVLSPYKFRIGLGGGGGLLRQLPLFIAVWNCAKSCRVLSVKASSVFCGIILILFSWSISKFFTRSRAYLLARSLVHSRNRRYIEIRREGAKSVDIIQRSHDLSFSDHMTISPCDHMTFISAITWPFLLAITGPFF